ncbi:MAG TPA: DegV family protein [Acidimicrobiales bacterium]|nr:DegV family protein [Acidimicrobiales bacterium]
MTIAVITDSSSDLPADLVAAHGIGVVPLSIRFGDEELVDGRDLTPAEFWARCASSPVLPETSAPSPGAFEVAFRAAAQSGADGVVCVSLSSKLSATIEAARAAAAALDGEVAVRVVDSRSVTMGLGMIVLATARAGASSSDVEEVAAVAAELAARTRVYGTLDTLENLKKGGRIGAAQALLGSILSVKPAIEVRDGAVEPGPRQRTRARALAWLADRVAADAPPGEVAVISGQAPDVDVLRSLVAAHVGDDRLVIANLGAVIGTHAGPRAVGVAYQVA